LREQIGCAALVETIVNGRAATPRRCGRLLVSFSTPSERNARDGWQSETGAPLQLTKPNLPNATDYKAERERSQDCENDYRYSGHRKPSFGLDRQLAAQGVTKPFLLVRCGRRNVDRNNAPPLPAAFVRRRTGRVLDSRDANKQVPLFLFRGRAGPPLGGQAAQQRRGVAEHIECSMRVRCS
jgi:hypothetical protein